MDLVEWLTDFIEQGIRLWEFGIESGYFFWEIVFLVCFYIIMCWYESIPAKTEIKDKEE